MKPDSNLNTLATPKQLIHARGQPYLELALTRDKQSFRRANAIPHIPLDLLIRAFFLEWRALSRVLCGKSVSTIDLEEFSEFLPDNPTIIETGAADETDTLLLAESFPGHRIIALEPNPRLFQRLSKRRISPRVTVQNLALSPVSLDQITLFTDAEVFSRSLLTPSEHKRVFPAVDFDGSVTVWVTSLDDLFLQNNLNRVDLLWLDLQGL